MRKHVAGRAGPIKNMKIINLECLLMDNNEIMFNGRSFGKISPEEQKKYIKSEKKV